MTGIGLTLEPPSGALVRDPSPRLVKILMGFLLLWSLALRIWFATPDLDPSRFWDERYGLRNIAQLLKGRGLRPANGFHPGLSYLPQAAALKASEVIHRVTGKEEFAVFGRRGSSFTPTAYLICRLTQALFGVLSLYLVFLLGRRLGGPWLGLLAAFLLSVVPWHIRQSVIFKPDILLVLTVLIAIYLSLGAVDRPSLGRYLAAGFGIGLALATKFNAGPVALPLALGTFLKARQSSRAFLWLVAAGLVSVAVFLLLNPFTLIDPGIYRHSFGQTLRHYELKGLERGGGSRLYLLWHVARSLLSEDFHGPWIGTVALISLVLLAAISMRRFSSSPSALLWLVALSYVAFYVTLYAVSTTNPSAHNWLPLTPFLALSAAWLLTGFFDRLTTAFPGGRRPVAGGLAAALFVLPVAWPGHVYTYRGVVPTTGHLAGNSLRPWFRNVGGRLIYSEQDVGVRARRRARQRMPYALVERLDTLKPAVLNLADAEIFLQSRLGEDGAGFFRNRMDRVPEKNVRIVKPRPFGARGPPLVVIAHPLRRRRLMAGEWVRSQEDRRLYDPRLSEGIKANALLSVEFRLPAKQGQRPEVTILSGGRELAAIPLKRSGKWLHYSSPRFRAGAGPRLRVTPPLASDRLAFLVKTWVKHKPRRAPPVVDDG